MNKLKQRILVELLEHPFFLIPATVGMSLILLSLAGISSLVLWGCAFLLLSGGALATNAVLNMDQIIDRAAVSLRQETKKIRDEQLDQLDADLVRTKGTDDQESLRLLRELYDTFYENIDRKRIDKNRVSSEVMELIDQIFAACIEKLSLSYVMYQQATNVAGDYRTRLMNQRKEMLNEIDRSIASLGETINSTRIMNFRSGSGDLKDLRLKLETQLSVAKATDEMLSRIQGQDLTRFSEYEGYTNTR